MKVKNLKFWNSDIEKRYGKDINKVCGKCMRVTTTFLRQRNLAESSKHSCWSKIELAHFEKEFCINHTLEIDNLSQFTFNKTNNNVRRVFCYGGEARTTAISLLQAEIHCSFKGTKLGLK